MHTHKHCFITLICVSTDLLKVANSIIIFSLTKLIWGAENYPYTPPIPWLALEERKTGWDGMVGGGEVGCRVSLGSIRCLEILIAVLCLWFRFNNISPRPLQSYSCQPALAHPRFWASTTGCFAKLYIWQPETCQNITLAILSRSLFS